MKPERYDYYGFPVFYRTEKRKVGTSLILSFRAESNNPINKQILYESNPIVIEKEIKAGMSTKEIVAARIPDYLRDMYSSEAELPAEYQRKSQKLPFAVVWELNRKMMAADANWAESTKQEYDRIAKELNILWGRISFTNLTPSFCAHELSKISRRKDQSAAALLRKLWDYEAAHGFVSTNPWVDYTINTRRDPMTPQKAKNKNVVRTHYSKEQSRVFVVRCIDGINISGYGSYYLAALIHFESALSFEEICALRFNSVQKLNHYRKCHVLNVKKHAVKHGKRYIQENVVNPPKIRGIPLSSALEKVLNNYIRDAKDAGIYADESPLIHNPKNISRVANPDDLRNWVDETFCDLAEQCNLETPVKGKKSAHELLTKTAKQHLYDSGLDDEELRYVLGQTPKATHAKHYCDFGNEAEKNKIKALLDRNANIYFPGAAFGSSQRIQKLRSEDAPCIWRNTAPDNRTEVDITFELPPLDAERTPEKGITVLLFAKHGARMNLCFEQNTAASHYTITNSP